MAKKETVKKQGKLEAYPREAIAMDIARESARRNIDVIVWYKRLISVSVSLLAASMLFTLVAALFAWRQAPPDVYASAVDGPLYEVDFSRNGSADELTILMRELKAESSSKMALGGQKTTVAGAVKAAQQEQAVAIAADQAKRAQQEKAAASQAGAPVNP